MPDYLFKIVLYILLAAGGGLLGGLVARIWSLRPKARSAIQHSAAGAVLVAMATSVVPEAEHLGTITGILSGLATGGLMMIALKWLVVKLEREEKSRHKLPIGLAAAAAVDTVLVVETIEAEESLFSTAMLFSGFLLLLALKLLGQDSP